MTKTNNSTDRILVLERTGDAKNTLGILDNRIFTGGNRLHVTMDTQTCIWSMRYDDGGLPQPLKVQFTSYTKLMRFVEEYFKRRGVVIKEVIM